ncbi:MAG: hypothetical protein ACTSRR_09755 [Candidatus Heimdallarchaeaceae archaeon]
MSFNNYIEIEKNIVQATSEIVVRLDKITRLLEKILNKLDEHDNKNNDEINNSSTTTTSTFDKSKFINVTQYLPKKDAHKRETFKTFCKNNNLMYRFNPEGKYQWYVEKSDQEHINKAVMDLLKK